MAPRKSTATKQPTRTKNGILPQTGGISRGGRRPTLTSPHVIFEILSQEGILWMMVRNIGAKPAFSIRIQFDQAFKGLGGTKQMNTLPLFTQLDFLGPLREIQVLLDQSAVYFHGNEPLRIVARVTFEEDNGHRYQTRSTHNLEVFRELGYVHPHQPIPCSTGQEH
jgi:hypothetical protein